MTVSAKSSDLFRTVLPGMLRKAPKGKATEWAAGSSATRAMVAAAEAHTAAPIEVGSPFFGLPLVNDDSLPHDVIELRAGKSAVASRKLVL